MTREDALKYVSWIIDEHKTILSQETSQVTERDKLIGWQCGFEPLFIAVRCDMPVEVADEIATEFLTERNWFSSDERDSDYMID